MAYIKLKAESFANQSGVGLSWIVQAHYYDDVLRRPYSTQYQSATQETFSLNRGDVVSVYEYRPGKTRQVLADGNGSVYTKNLAGVAISTLAVKADTTTPYTEAADSADASVDLTGTLGQPPYRITLVGTVGTPSANYRKEATSNSENYPVRFYNLPQGQYVALVRDALNNLATRDITVKAGTGKARGVRLLERRLVITSTHLRWRFNNTDVKFYPADKASPYGEDVLAYGTYVDGFLLAGGATWRQVYSDGKGGVYFLDASTASTSTLELDNLLLFHPDTAGEQNGGVLVEVRATAPPVSFRLTGTTASGTITPQTSQTGSFDDLAAGDYTVTVTDAVGKTLAVPFSLSLRYGLWQQLVYDDLESRALRVELWLRGYQGDAGDICGQAQPVVLKSDGLNSAVGGQGDVPPVVGTSAELNLLVAPDLLEPVVIGDDRLCRVDVYYNDALEFRGYVQPDIYTAPLLDGLQPVSLTATDGLAALKDTYMLGHAGQRLHGHRPALHTILHCLSRCDVALPLRLYVNRRDATMSDEDAPELAATTNRTGYYDDEKNEPIYQRTVLDALTQALGGTLCQRGGAWEVRSALEALADALGRAYKPAGTGLAAVTATAPSGTIRPPGAQRLHWQQGDQAKHVRAGWKSLTGKTDAGWLENAFPAGAVFSDRYAWLEDGSQLRAITSWKPAAGTTFPLVLSRAGEKGSDYATLWPRSSGLRVGDGRYLESPLLPLAAGTEAVPAYLQVSGKLVPTEFYQDTEGQLLASPITATKAILAYEVVVDGQGTGQRLAEVAAVAGSSAKDVTFEAFLPALPSTAGGAALRVYAWWAADTMWLDKATTITLLEGLGDYPKGAVVRYAFGTSTYRLFVARQDAAPGLSFLAGTYANFFAEITATNVASGTLLLSRIGVQLRPQGATWEGEDNFRADGPGGNVRPTEALTVYHPDVPLAAGLYGGNLYAFGKGVALADGTMSTSWARAIDRAASPLFEANVLDGLALRAGASRLLTGTLRHAGVAPPRLLDSLDTPSDVPGRRFMVAAWEWDMRAAQATVSLVEIGPGADAEPPELPTGVRLTHRAYAYAPGMFTPRPRRTHAGHVRVRH